MSAHFTPTDEMLLLAETLGEVKTKTEKLEAEFSTQARPLEAATNALSAALAGIKALQFHVLDNNLGALSARVEEMRKAVDEQVGVIALELKKADETNAAKAGQDAEALRAEIAGLQAQLGTLGAQFTAQLARVEFAAKEEAKKLQLIPGPAGATGASLNPRGTFVDGETYNRLDVVSWLGSSYIASVDGVTEKPSKNSNQWQVLASRGGGAAGGAGDFGSLAGVAQINQGGTGQTTRAAGLNALLPSQTGNTQYMLLTDGAGTVSWGAQPVAGLPSQTSNSGKLLTTDGTNASWSGAVTVSGSNATVTGTLTGGTVTDGYITISSAQINRASQQYVELQYNKTAAGEGVRIFGNTSNAITFNSGILTISGTTASTSTSTGALVVGGGVGVAKELYVGGGLGSFITSSGDSVLEVKTSSTGAVAPYIRLVRSTTGGARTWWLGVGIDGGTDDSLQLYDATGSATRLRVSNAGNLTAGGSVTTAAPSGGTAAAWKLGTVASVSPTSPNRTIEVDIGGTIYYIAAKTTNN